MRRFILYASLLANLLLAAAWATTAYAWGRAQGDLILWESGTRTLTHCPCPPDPNQETL
jgi:hypothetical protein